MGQSAAADGTRAVTFWKPIGIGLVIAAAFVVTYLVALHKPQAHHLPVGVVASAPMLAQLRQAVAARVGDAVDLRPEADEQQARHLLQTGLVVGVYVPGSNTLLVAGAQGLPVSQALTAIFAGVSAATGVPLQVVDVVPLTPQDPRGLSLFYLAFGITLGAFIFGQTSHLYGKRLSAPGKLVQALAFALPVGLTGTVIAHTWIRALPGSFLAIAGVLTLLAAAVGLFTVALTELFGDPGIAVATLVAVILSNVVAGGAMPTYFLPDGFRQLTTALPSGAATGALRHLGYLDPAGAIGPVLVLAAWATVSALIAGILVRHRQSPGRRDAVEPHPLPAPEATHGAHT